MSLTTCTCDHNGAVILTEARRIHETHSLTVGALTRLASLAESVLLTILRMSREPLAYFITFHTYGSWLHGDEKGSVDDEHNAFSAPLLKRDDERREANHTRLKHAEQKLNAERRWVVHHTIIEVCEHRRWSLHALHVRTNHVHVVVTATHSPERVMNNLKSWCTRRMREAGVLGREESPWSYHGSTRYLWSENQVAERSEYVLDQQGEKLPMVQPKRA